MLQQLVFHAETEAHVDGMLNKIKSKNVRAGVALKPGTSLSVLDCVLEKCDTVLLMLINPGFAWNKAGATSALCGLENQRTPSHDQQESEYVNRS